LTGGSDWDARPSPYSVPRDVDIQALILERADLAHTPAARLENGAHFTRQHRYGDHRADQGEGDTQHPIEQHRAHRDVPAHTEGQKGADSARFGGREERGGGQREQIDGGHLGEVDG